MYSFGLWLLEHCWFIAALVFISTKHILHLYRYASPLLVAVIMEFTATSGKQR